MPILGFDIFIQENDKKQINKNQLIFCTGKGAKANAILLDDGKARVLKGLTVIKENSPSFNSHNYKKIKDELIKINRLVVKDKFLYFIGDYVFDSLSASAAVVLARSAQGPKEWKYKNGGTVKDFIEE